MAIDTLTDTCDVNYKCGNQHQYLMCFDNMHQSITFDQRRAKQKHKHISITVKNKYEIMYPQTCYFVTIFK